MTLGYMKTKGTCRTNPTQLASVSGCSDTCAGTLRLSFWASSPDPHLCGIFVLPPRNYKSLQLNHVPHENLQQQTTAQLLHLNLHDSVASQLKSPTSPFFPSLYIYANAIIILHKLSSAGRPGELAGIRGCHGAGTVMGCGDGRGAACAFSKSLAGKVWWRAG